jgi:hypothetical protein
MSFCATAGAAELAVFDFVQHPTLTDPVISPDGKHLAATLNENSNSTDARYQLAVLSLPDLKPISRLDMAPRFLRTTPHDGSIGPNDSWFHHPRSTFPAYRGHATLHASRASCFHVRASMER